MDILFYIFVALASLASVAILALVIREMILDAKNKEKAPAEQAVEAVAEQPPEPEEITAENIEENVPIPETIVTSILIDEEAESVEVINIEWSEKPGRTYRYAPNGTDPHDGDSVLVPTFDRNRGVEITRRATVHGEVYSIAPEDLRFRLKPILRILAEPASMEKTEKTEKAEKAKKGKK